MNKFMNAFVKTMYKSGEVTFRILCLVWTLACMLVALIACIPATLMDFIDYRRRPWGKQFGVVGVIYIASRCIIAPLRFVGWSNESIEDRYKDICEDYKNGL